MEFKEYLESVIPEANMEINRWLILDKVQTQRAAIFQILFDF